MIVATIRSGKNSHFARFLGRFLVTIAGIHNPIGVFPYVAQLPLAPQYSQAD